MKQFLLTLQRSVLLIAFLAKAFVPTGMMLDVQSFMRGGDLITICPSVGKLPWMTAYVDHSNHEMVGIDENADEHCPYAALDIPTDLPTLENTFYYDAHVASKYAVTVRAFSHIVMRRAARTAICSQQLNQHLNI